MAQNNSSASIAGPARLAGARLKKRGLNSSAAVQLFLEQRRRALRNSTSPESDSSSQSSPSPPSLSSLSRKVKFSDVAQALILHRHLSKPLAPGKLAKLYSRHRNPERALSLFLLRRQLWRRSRRPTFNMDFVDHLRRIQADEVSSDEESGLILTSVTTPVPHRRQSPSLNSIAVTARSQPVEAQVTVAKRNRGPIAEPASAEETSAETSRTAKKAKAPTPIPAVDSKPASVTTGGEPAPQSNGVNGSKKRVLEDQKTEGEGEQPAAKKIKPENRNVMKPVATKAESSKAASATPVSQKPIGRMEYFEQRVHEMLTDPLEFDDFVYDSNKPIPRHVARSFARCRRGQTQPPPPLVMSGAIGSASDAKSAITKPKGSGNLAKEAQKRAHQQKIKEQVHTQKGKAVEGRGFVGSKQPVMSKANGGKGKGKERAWLTNARQRPNVNLGGQQHQGGVKKYNKSTYSNVPTMSGAKADKSSPSDMLKAHLPTTTNQTADVELPTIPRPIDHEATIMSSAISTAVPSNIADSAKVPTMSGAIDDNKAAKGGTSPVPVNIFTATLDSNASQKKTNPQDDHPSHSDHKPGTA